MQIVRSGKNADNVPIIVWLAMADSQTIAYGDLIQINGTSRKGEAAVAASTTIVGIAQQAITTTTATAADVIPVAIVRREVVRMAVSQAGTKKTFADTDKYTTAYDLLNKTSIAPDDTTGGMCYVQAYDNTNNTVDVIFADANLANVG
ncbi:hypothetical protein A8709_32990 [Paenibacillus pectinilyticus]|uniref:DUF2190 domain-containing protein n=1 Tax=Paenibacillus pectinilyticus TaxID=512399 RepID=A0A1C0ZX66_9BACL|nr:hypothetical protein [Paenibacillus pectinilyticus]OCT12628.1 hypothetical protein A8709_32990 [Paenibacillus pectinilyticus]